MHFATIIPLLALLPAISLGKPIITTARAESTVDKVATAVNNWASDTSLVSEFLSRAASLRGFELERAAQAALATAKDEPVQKAALDRVFVTPGPPQSVAAVVAASGVLDDVFPDVVNGLSILALNGASLTEAAVERNVREINTVRCGKVLPAIDEYFRASAQITKTGVVAVANRPDNCPSGKSD
ncbi:hypothetical protein GGR56DRAFT_673486 [Xylariaceae sp. FL0804]|nr:hypothetical protein GGR56DRAFT_673486 [Xylariaceae sp. FL0804]